jgi:hypothetical protein
MAREEFIAAIAASCGLATKDECDCKLLSAAFGSSSVIERVHHARPNVARAGI